VASLCAFALFGALMAGDSMSFQIVVPDSVRVGEPVAITLRLTNTTDRPLMLNLLGRPIAFDITVRRTDGTVVWQRLKGAVVSQILAVRTLQSGTSLEFKDVWRQTSTAGEPVPPGHYTVTGTLPTDSPPGLRSAPVSLHIVSRH